jgi:O-antigen ligase/tetratricopeptide (TPR) repeat protein
LGATIEFLVLLMVCVSPWAFGSVEPVAELLLYAGLAVLLLLWGVRMLINGQVSWQKCPVMLCLAALFLAGIGQVIPMPKDLLSWLSPATARMYDRLLPSRVEVLPLGATQELSAVPAGSTLSFYPGATRHELVKILAVFLLFVVVRNNVTPGAGLRRLSIVALVNGTFLAFFGLIQYFTSPHNTLYWSYASQGQVFGPFICRNHFAFYVNLCIGLGAGLLLASRSLETEPTGGRRGAGSYKKETTGRKRRHARSFEGTSVKRSWWSECLDLLQDPRSLWICCALALMLGSTLFCLSRGGLLGVLSGLAVCLGLKYWHAAPSLRFGYVLLILALAIAFVCWFGFDPVEARFATLLHEDALQSRFSLWSHAWPVVKDFFFWGTGSGTFPYIEPMHRTTTADLNTIYEHAHNEYLEALVEGGLLRLIPSLLAVGLVFRLGFRAFKRHGHSLAGGLVLGAVASFTAMAVHSFGEFGLHIPAIAVLATVLCAQLCSLADSPPPSPAEIIPLRDIGDDSSRVVLRLGGLAPILGAVCAVALGLALVGEGWRVYQVERLRSLAASLNDSAEPARRDQQIAYLETAARLAPEYARLRSELGQAHLDLVEARTEKLEQGEAFQDTVQAVLSFACLPNPGVPVFPLIRSATSFLAASTAWSELAAREEQRLRSEHLVPGLQHYLQARDLCPLMGKPHIRIAANIASLDKADLASTYFERAQLLVPCDPELWYLSGLQELLDEQPQRAWASWRHCLELSDGYLTEILSRSARMMTPTELIGCVLPDKPALLVQAALQLFPKPESVEERRPFLEKALTVLASKEGVRNAEDLHLQGFIQGSLGRITEARNAYRAALALKSERLDWRYEWAQLLHQHGHLQEMQQELQIILQRQPDHGAARELWNSLPRQAAEPNSSRSP